MINNLTCTICSTDFTSPQAHTKFCSGECRKEEYGRKWGRASNGEVNPGTVGALAEMACAVDLMEKGYAVFRALSPSCFCDLIAIKNGILRVEVRTGYKGEMDKISFPTSKKDNDRQDIFAVYVRSEKRIAYFLPSKEPTEL